MPQIKRVCILAATILGSSMVFIDGTVVNVALPALQTNLHASVVDVQWVIEAYALFLAALLLTGGSLGDEYGRKKIYAIGVAVFTLASIWCGLAPDVYQLILARAAQGVGGALLVPGSLAIISASFPETERGQAIGTWSGFTAITTAAGPLLGGWLIEHVSWRAIFFINVPLGIAVLVLLFLYVPESRDEESRGLDLSGAALATASLGAVVYGLIESSRFGFSNSFIIASLVGGLALAVAFVVIEARKKNPMLPISLFKSGNFAGANLLTLFLYTALTGALFFLPLNLIQVQGYSATAAGAAFLPFVLIMFALSRWAGGLVKKYGSRLPLIVGPTTGAAGFALLMVPGTGGSYWTTYFPAVVVVGLGMTVSVAPLTTTVMNAVSQNRAGVASGINNAVSRVAGLMAIAILGIVMLHSFNSSLNEKLTNSPISDDVIKYVDAQRERLAAIDVSYVPSEEREIVTRAVNESFVSGFRRVCAAAALLAIASAGCAAVMIDKKQRRKAR